ncbi:MAG: Dps family protein [Porphyromonas sp.]|nr:Dps family protein [Porphyromonas sp.]
MKVTKYTNIKDSDAKKVNEILNVYLASLHVHYANLRTHHWHVKDSYFFVTHEQTEELYNEAFEQIDAVAERILMLDGNPVRKFAEIEKLSKVAEVEVTTDSVEIVKYILDTTKVLNELEREILDLTDEVGDITTNDLITGYLAGREKMAWMLVSFLNK